MNEAERKQRFVDSVIAAHVSSKLSYVSETNEEHMKWIVGRANEIWSLLLATEKKADPTR